MAALASWCDARHRGGQWLVRMEDLDPPREVPGAAADILRTLEGFGLHLGRSSRALPVATPGGVCGCIWNCLIAEGQGVRLRLHAQNARTVTLSTRDTCRKQGYAPGGRMRGAFAPLRSWGQSKRGDWHRRCPGPTCPHGTAEMLADFRGASRADGLWAYQLAVVVDDVEQGVNAVVQRGRLAGQYSGAAGVAGGFGPLGRAAGRLGPPAAAGQCGRAEVEQANLGRSMWRWSDSAMGCCMAALQLLGQLSSGWRR